MPGPVSDSFDPEFGTGANAGDVNEAIQAVRARITELLGNELENIVSLVHGPPGLVWTVGFSERELRVIRFCLDRSMESV